jgi:hypothetical protein
MSVPCLHDASSRATPYVRSAKAETSGKPFIFGGFQRWNENSKCLEKQRYVRNAHSMATLHRGARELKSGSGVLVRAETSERSGAWRHRRELAIHYEEPSAPECPALRSNERSSNAGCSQSLHRRQDGTVHCAQASRNDLPPRCRYRQTHRAHRDWLHGRDDRR